MLTFRPIERVVLDRRTARATSSRAPVRASLAPTTRFRKEVLRVGKFTHPATGEEIEIEAEDLPKLARDTARWTRELGHKVPFLASHEDAGDAEAVLGYWLPEGWSVEGDRLVGEVEVFDPDALGEVLETRDVSCQIAVGARASAGDQLEMVIEHVAATPAPVVTGLAGFARLSASRPSGVEQLERERWRSARSLAELEEAAAEAKASVASLSRSRAQAAADFLVGKPVQLGADPNPRVRALAARLDGAAARVPLSREERVERRAEEIYRRRLAEEREAEATRFVLEGKKT